MVSFIHISDIHYNSDYSTSPIVRLYAETGLTLTEQFITVMRHISANYPEADFFLISGDLVHNGTVEEYLELRELIESLTGGRPCYIAAGNHDTGALRSGWTCGELTGEKFDYAVIEEKSGLKIIVLDSRGGPYGSGSLTGEQLAWLRGKLEGSEPSILMLHHTPNSGDVEYLKYQMQKPEEIYSAVQGSGLLGIFSGHTHKRFSSVFCGIPCFTVPSISFGITTDEYAMTLSDVTGYNYCTYCDGKLRVKSVDIPGKAVSLSFKYDEIPK